MWADEHFPTSVLRYRARPDSNCQLRECIVSLAGQRRRFVYRLYRNAGLAVRKRNRKRIGLAERVSLFLPETPNHAWSMDFVHDDLADGRRIRCLNGVDDCTRESIVIEVDTSISGERMARVLERIAGLRPLPRMIRVDHGPEFTSVALDKWAHAKGVKLAFTQPGKPTQNAYIESFNGHFRDECLNDHWFSTLHEARVLIEAWRKDYNSTRPHSSLGNITPAKFAAQHLFKTQDSTAPCS